MRKILTILVSCCFTFFGYAQLLVWTPDFPQQNDAGNLVITMDANKGNQGLLNYSPSTDVYVHVGVITNLSTGASDWKYVKFMWATTNSLAQCTYIGNNKWQYTINGSLRSFFSITNASENIQKIAILFRNGNGTNVQRNGDGSDMYIPIYNNSVLSLRFSIPLFQPTYISIPEPINKQAGDNINITAISNKTADLALVLNGSLIQAVNGTTSVSANPTLSAGGQIVHAAAILGSDTAITTFNFFVAPPVNTAPLPAGVKDGINYESGDSSVILVLYAPQKSRVSVIGEFPGNNWIEQSQYVMNKTSDNNYWWLRITGLIPGTEYAFQYLVDGTLKVGEPYSEKILDPSNDPFIPAPNYPGLRSYPAGQSGIVSIVQTASPSYNWSIINFNRPDKKIIMVYELLIRDFIAAQNWSVLSDTLNYLKNLGINAIEIMPFNEFDGNLSWGYNPSYFLAPDKYYGPKNILKRFIDSSHNKGIAVIMDIALNHATANCPLAALYWNSATNQPASNNPWFNVTATHPFSVFNDFNHESSATKYFFNRVVAHWLSEYKVDGFRFDLSKGFTQVNSGNNVALWSQYDASRVAIWKRYYDTLQVKSPGSYVILEHFADNIEEKELSDYGMLLWGNMNYNFNQASMGFMQNSNFEQGIFTVRTWTQPHLVTYMESHDEERLMYKNITFGNSSGSYDTKDLSTALKRMEMCAAFFASIPGPKMMWQFGELGYDYSITSCHPGNTIPQPYPNGQCRTDPKPIRWDYLQQVQRKRLFDIYAALFKLRSNPAYKDAFVSNRVNQDLAGTIKWIKVTTDTSNLLVIGNFDLTQQSANLTFQNAGTWYDYLNGNTISATGAVQDINLQPGEYHLYVNRNITNVVATPVTNISYTSDGLWVKIYPNPVLNQSYVDLNIAESGNVYVELLNTIGQKITDVYSGFLIKGKHTFPLNLGKMSTSGNYILRVFSGNNTATIKFVLN